MRVQRNVAEYSIDLAAIIRRRDKPGVSWCADEHVPRDATFPHPSDVSELGRGCIVRLHMHPAFGCVRLPASCPATDGTDVMITPACVRRRSAASSVRCDIPPHASATTCT